MFGRTILHLDAAMPNNSSFISTGIQGLDEILMGGFVPSGFYLVQGDPGSGKTTLALQFVRGRIKAGQSCLYVSLTETRRDLERAAASHGWTLEHVHICDLSRSPANMRGETQVSVFHPSETELGETTQAVIAEVDRIKPTHVVFDGLAEMRLMSGDALRYRRQLLSLKAYFEDKKITVLCLDDRTFQLGEISPKVWSVGISSSNATCRNMDAPAAGCLSPKFVARNSARATMITNC
jgi:circadian clock protein KaiC